MIESFRCDVDLTENNVRDKSYRICQLFDENNDKRNIVLVSYKAMTQGLARP
jgi:hypothetical protein